MKISFNLCKKINMHPRKKLFPKTIKLNVRDSQARSLFSPRKLGLLAHGLSYVKAASYF